MTTEIGLFGVRKDTNESVREVNEYKQSIMKYISENIIDTSLLW